MLGTHRERYTTLTPDASTAPGVSVVLPRIYETGSVVTGRHR